VEFLDHLRRPVTANERESGPYPYYGANGQQDSVAGYLFDEPLVLLAEDGGYFEDPDKMIAYQVNGKCWVNNHAHVLRPTERINVRYLCRHLENYDVRPYIAGTTRSKLTKGQAERIPLAVPPLYEQQRIAAILDKADAIRRKRQEALDALGELRRSQFERWFSPLFQENAEDAHVPVSSFVKRFEGGINLATPDSATPETRDYILKVSAVTWGDYRPEECKPLPSEYSPPPDHYVREGDLLFSRANTTELVGATVYVFETPPDRILPDKLWRFVWKEPSRVEPLFVWALFNHPKIRYEIGRRATGTSGSMKNISMDKALSILVPFPDVQEQRRFANYLRGDRDLRGKMCNAIEEANRLFSCLVERAFRGEL
jgi:type I restriction enzyme S subunit